MFSILNLIIFMLFTKVKLNLKKRYEQQCCKLWTWSLSRFVCASVKWAASDHSWSVSAKVVLHRVLMKWRERSLPYFVLKNSFRRIFGVFKYVDYIFCSCLENIHFFFQFKYQNEINRITIKFISKFDQHLLHTVWRYRFMFTHY